MAKIIRNGLDCSGAADKAVNITYNNLTSGLTAANVLSAIDELKTDFDELKDDVENMVDSLLELL